MVTICAPSPFPVFSAISSAIRNVMPQPPIAFPGINLTMPNMPTMPGFGWPSFNAPLLQLDLLAAQIQSLQFFSNLSSIGSVLASYTSFAWPSMPGLPSISLPQLLARQPASLLASLRSLAILPSGNLSFSFLPTIPSPIFPSIQWEDLELMTALQTAASAYLGTVAALLRSVVNTVANILEISGSLSLPAFPSLGFIMSQLQAPTLPNLRELVFPGFGNFSLKNVIPDPLFVGFSLPEFEFIQGLSLLYNGLGSYLISRIANFVTNILNLALSLPRICIPIGISSASTEE